MLLVDLPTEARERLRGFRDLLLRWNLRFNLTALSDPEAVDQKLIADALAMLPALGDAITTAGATKTPRLIDIGSGAGLPGLVLKIARPALDVTLVEATGKKVTFLRAAITELGLTGIRAIHARAEDLGQHMDHREHYELVTARAVAALPTLMELCVPFLRIGGVGLFPKGMEIADELSAGERAGQLVGARIVSSQLVTRAASDPPSRLVIVVKLASTPNRYPRRSGLPAKEPLGRVDR